ncbi:hypothetical protein [Aeromonas veronii]|uniref:hypothetical protein n=1 Tax=Aeromonas veronii TaxID=654 RepID=UPI00300552E2
MDGKRMYDDYNKMYVAFESARSRYIKMENFNNYIKNDKCFLRLRNNVRHNFTELYSAVAKEFGLPEIPIYITTRKKNRVLGLTFYPEKMPSEVRIYPFRANGDVNQEYLKPSDINCESLECIFETAVHEFAHVLDIIRRGKSDHEYEFVQSYLEIYMFLSQTDYGRFFDKRIVLTGCPESSYANEFRTLNFCDN